jgi:hypothetical protein
LIRGRGPISSAKVVSLQARYKRFSRGWPPIPAEQRFKLLF